MYAVDTCRTGLFFQGLKGYSLVLPAQELANLNALPLQVYEGHRGGACLSVDLNMVMQSVLWGFQI